VAIASVNQPVPVDTPPPTITLVLSIEEAQYVEDALVKSVPRYVYDVYGGDTVWRALEGAFDDAGIEVVRGAAC
jgi:hypothetical protein